jgi:nitroimidazol reductase NimA-like FMN-containing flavoprotein (pyridoxamine 5'-phosphate oxidase superfamily)
MGILLQEDDESRFEVLDEDECRSLLARATIGRVAVSMAAIPAVFPVNYAVDGGDIFFLTGEGTKLGAAVRGAVVAFEADDVDTRRHRGWSVLAVGEAHEVAPGDAGALAEQLALHPWAPGRRSHLVRIRPDFLSGRRIAGRPA